MRKDPSPGGVDSGPSSCGGPPRGWRPALSAHFIGARGHKPAFRARGNPAYPGPGSPGDQGALDRDRAVLDGERDGFELGVDAQLAQDVPDVGLDRLWADEELGGDVVVAHAFGEQLQDLAFAFREVVQEVLRVALRL